MKMTLELVRQILKESIGFDSFISGFISEVEESSKIPTAAITPDGKLMYNSGFTDSYIKSKEDLNSVLLHEILHRLFNHFIFKSDNITNIACDSIINALISTLFSQESNSGSLFKNLYDPKGVEGLLRPASSLYRSRFEKVYRRLYGQTNSADKLTTGEMITTLKVLLDSSACSNITLLGSHDATGSKTGWPVEILEKVAFDFKRAIQEKASNAAGYSLNVVDLMYEVLRSHMTIKRQILSKMATTRKIDRFKELFSKKRITSSPIPIYPSKRDMVLLSIGFYPGFFHNRINSPMTKEKGLAIYLDVSGSVDSYLPKILSILRNLKNEITSIFLFSNKVVEVPFSSVMNGKIKTTGGTDFDCIAVSIIDKRYDKVIVVTDGFASMKSENKQKLKQQNLITLTILFDRAQRCPEFESFGDIVLLDDITH